MDKKLILIADDEQDILDLYTTALTQAGFEIITASNGNETIEIAKQKHPALILMDVKMPVLDGIEAASRIKADPEMASTKIVFLTAFSDYAEFFIDINTIKGLEKIAFIKKGIALNELIAEVKYHLTQEN